MGRTLLASMCIYSWPSRLVRNGGFWLNNGFQKIEWLLSEAMHSEVITRNLSCVLSNKVITVLRPLYRSSMNAKSQ